MSDSNLRAATQRSSVIDLPNGEQIEFRPLILRDWGTLEEEALKEFKRQWLQHKIDTLDLLNPDDPVAERERYIEQASDLTLDDCKDKMADYPARDAAGRLFNGTGLKVGDIIKTNNGDKPVTGFIDSRPTVNQKVPYINWWLSRTIKGRFMSTWLSARKARPTMTYDQCAEMMLSLSADMQGQLIDTVADLSKASVGNDVAPQAAAGR